VFPALERRRPSNETGAKAELFFKDLGALQKHFSFYFKDADISKSEWVRNAFIASQSNNLLTRAACRYIL
jgi:hypothetical protein